MPTPSETLVTKLIERHRQPLFQQFFDEWRSPNKLIERLLVEEREDTVAIVSRLRDALEDARHPRRFRGGRHQICDDRFRDRIAFALRALEKLKRVQGTGGEHTCGSLVRLIGPRQVERRLGHAAGERKRAINTHRSARCRSSLRGIFDFLARILVYPPYLPRFCRRTAAAACALTTESTLSDFPPAI